MYLYRSQVDDYDKSLKMCELYLLVYLEVMPLLINFYQRDKDDVWGPEPKKEFLKSVGAKLIEKVEEKAENI
jgi:hypothetical protein